jgi:hypothetical protein
MNSDFTMPRRSDRCFSTERVFEVGDEIAVILLETPAGYERRDYAAEAAPELLEMEIARWRTTKRAPSQPSPHAIDRAAIYEFFRRLSEPDSPHKLQFRFVLALLLWRKKVLSLERSEMSDSGEIWHFSSPRSGEVFEVTKPELDDEDVERLGNQLEALLSEGAGALQFVATDSEGE